MNARPLATALTIAMLAGCASAGSSPTLLPGDASNTVRSTGSNAVSMKKHRRVKGYAHIIIRRPKKKHRGSGYNPRFISSATLGAEFVVQSDTGGSVTTDANLSPSSPYCTTTEPNTSSCTVPVSMPFGNDTITITTYAQTPTSGGFNPTTELAVGSQTQTVTLGGPTPTINIFLSGVVDSIDAGPAFSSLPADGTASSEVFVVNGRDFGNVKIKAGTNDPYSNPITARLTESGDNGSNHSTLQLNGGTAGTKAVLTQSTDSLQLNFDGTGRPGYTATVTFSATGAPDQTIEISPLYVTAPQIRQHILNLNGGIAPQTMTITETDAPANTTYTVTRTGCTGIATASAVSGTGPSATFNAQGGATASASGCVFNVADSNSPTTPFVLPATNTPIAGTEVIGGVQLSDYGSPSTLSYITVGPDRNLWMVEPPSGLLVVTPSGPPPAQPTIQRSFTVPSGTGSPPPSSLQGIATGPDGAIWLTDATNGGVDRVNVANGTIANYPSNQSPSGIASANTGTMWIGSGQFETLVNLTVGGDFTPILASPSNEPMRIVQAPDGGIWFTEGNKVGRYDPVGMGLQEINVPSGGAAFDLCAEPNGNIWLTANSSTSNVYQITGTPGSFTVSTFNVAAGASLTGIACGVDNAIWYLDSGNNAVGRISLNPGNKQTTYAIPDANFGPRYITVGPDGSLWYTSNNASLFGHIIP